MAIKIPLPVKVPNIVKRFYPNYVWDQSHLSEKTLYLTFDDGPIPEVTPWVLEQLNTYNAKATFFCIGDNVYKHPKIFNQLLSEKHRVGNHTFNHLNGWQTKTKHYIENTIKADQEFLKIVDNGASYTPKLFRPPYGKIKRKQANLLRQQGFKIIMYDVIAYDWDSSITQEKCLKNVLHNTINGSIIVFHDSLKAYEHLKYALPKVLEYYTEKGYKFKSL